MKIYEQNNLFGLKDDDGTVILPAKFYKDFIKYGFINEKGEKVAECKYDWINDFQSNGLAVVELDKKLGLINEKGEIVVECK